MTVGQSPTAMVDAFAVRVQGDVLRPNDAGYDEARAVWNGMIDRFPALIVRCTGVRDVVACVRLAREHDLLVTVRGGGHNVAGTAVRDGGLVIDLSPMREVDVDPETRRVRAGAGATWGDADRATQPPLPRQPEHRAAQLIRPRQKEASR